MLVQHHSQRIHHVAATYPSTAEPRKYLPQSRKTSVIVPIRLRILGDVDAEGLVARDVGCSHWMFLFSAFMAASTPFDFCDASRRASRSAEPISGMSLSITYLGMALLRRACIRSRNAVVRRGNRYACARTQFLVETSLLRSCCRPTATSPASEEPVCSRPMQQVGPPGVVQPGTPEPFLPGRDSAMPFEALACNMLPRGDLLPGWSTAHPPHPIYTELNRIINNP